MSFVPNDVDRHLECPICLKAFDAPVVALPCNHIFCEPCLKQLDWRRACPLCRATITDTTQPSQYLRTLSCNVLGLCDGFVFPSDPEDGDDLVGPCPWTGSRTDFLKHREETQHFQTPVDGPDDNKAKAEEEEERDDAHFRDVLSSYLGPMLLNSPDDAFAAMDAISEERRQGINMGRPTGEGTTNEESRWGVSLHLDLQMAMNHPTLAGREDVHGPRHGSFHGMPVMPIPRLHRLSVEPLVSPLVWTPVTVGPTVLGQGSYGTVYLARDVANRRVTLEPMSHVDLEEEVEDRPEIRPPVPSIMDLERRELQRQSAAQQQRDRAARRGGQRQNMGSRRR